jgi:hypothetical protein
MRGYAAIEEDSWADAARRHSTLLATLIGLVVLRTILYLHDVFYYHHIQRRPRLQQQEPPKYPAFFSYIGLGIPLGWDIRRAIARFTYVIMRLTHLCRLMASHTKLTEYPFTGPTTSRQPLFVSQSSRASNRSSTKTLLSFVRYGSCRTCWTFGRWPPTFSLQSSA